MITICCDFLTGPGSLFFPDCYVPLRCDKSNMSELYLWNTTQKPPSLSWFSSFQSEVNLLPLNPLAQFPFSFLCVFNIQWWKHFSERSWDPEASGHWIQPWPSSTKIHWCSQSFQNHVRSVHTESVGLWWLSRGLFCRERKNSPEKRAGVMGLRTFCRGEVLGLSLLEFYDMNLFEMCV